MGIFKHEIHRDIRGEKFEGFFNIDIEEDTEESYTFFEHEIHGNFRGKNLRDSQIRDSTGIQEKKESFQA